MTNFSFQVAEHGVLVRGKLVQFDAFCKSPHISYQENMVHVEAYVEHRAAKSVMV